MSREQKSKRAKLATLAVEETVKEKFQQAVDARGMILQVATAQALNLWVAANRPQEVHGK